AAPRAPFVTIGLIGETPEVALAGARDAFASGAPDAEARALALTALIDGSVAVGRGRVTAAAVGVGVAAILLIVLVLVLRRRRRHRRQALAAAGGPTEAAMLDSMQAPMFGPYLVEMSASAAEAPGDVASPPVVEP